MIIGLAIILIVSVILGYIFNLLKIPKLIGYLLIGIVAGPYVFNLIDDKILSISSELRQIALIIILTRAGLSLDVDKIKEVGIRVLLLSFLPATLEIIGVMIIAPILFGISYIDALLLGSVLAAVSPAVIVPSMIKMKEEGYGLENNIPELITVGASLDDIYVIVLFTSFLNLSLDNNFNIISMLLIPVNIILGIIIGFVFSKILNIFFEYLEIDDNFKVILMMGLSLLLLYFEKELYYSGLLAIITFSILLKKETTKNVKSKYNSLWSFFEIILFVLVGASLDLSLTIDYGYKPILLIGLVMLFRMAGVLISLLKSNLSNKEKMFVVLSYIPKATVQASIGGIALESGLSSGNIILVVAVTSIIVTAPIGALLINRYYKNIR